MIKMLKRISYLILGQITIAFGIALVIDSQLGAFPITLTNLSLSNLTGLSFGLISMLVELIIILFCLLFKSKIGIATLFNGILGGYFIDLILLFLPVPAHIILKLIYLLFGSVTLIIGFYIQGNARLGKTSSNLLTACIRKRYGLSITTMKLIQETTFTLIGLIGAFSQFGFATIILAIFFGKLMDFIYKLLNYDPTKVEHTYITFKNKK